MGVEPTATRLTGVCMQLWLWHISSTTYSRRSGDNILFYQDIPPGNTCYKYEKSMEHFILPTDFPSFLS